MRTAIIFAASLAVISSPAFAQYSSPPYDLATTRDGSVLYFSAGAPSSSNTKIYRWSLDAGVTLFGDRPDFLQGEHLYGTELTDSGAVIYHAEPLCFTGTGPGFNNCTAGQTQVVIPNFPQFSVEGFLLISPNGRYGVFPSDSGMLWVDWFTGQEIQVPAGSQRIPIVSPPFFVNQHAVSNNGTFLLSTSYSVSVWSPSGFELLLPTPPNYSIDNASISSDGSTVVVVAGNIPFVFDLASGRQTGFPAGSQGGYLESFTLSDDGKRVAYLVNSQVMVANSDGTNATQITNVAAGVYSAQLSGDARYVYVVNRTPDPNTFQMQRYEVATGTVINIPGLP
jgi:hypothetical protein